MPSLALATSGKARTYSRSTHPTTIYPNTQRIHAHKKSRLKDFFWCDKDAHPPRDGQPNLITDDFILGKTVYWVLAPQNLSPNQQIKVEIQSESPTGNTNASEVVYLNASRHYPSAQTLIAVVDNFDAPSNNTNACPYSNLACHAHHAINKR